MNPRRGQYALGNTLHGWSSLVAPTPKQSRALRLAYRGINPHVYSRYGLRQWAAPLPWTRVVIKDPYALLSTAAIHRITGAIPVLVYRHPGAVMASYRRMNWTPVWSEVSAVRDSLVHSGHTSLPELSPDSDLSGATAFGWFWSVLHEIALLDAVDSGTIIVSHAELASGGPAAGRRLAEAVGLRWNDAMAGELSRESGGVAAGAGLHNFDRAPAEVAEAWRRSLEPQTIEEIEAVSNATLTKLDDLRIRLGG